MPVILALRRWRQEDQKFKVFFNSVVSLGHVKLYTHTHSHTHTEMGGGRGREPGREGGRQRMASHKCCHDLWKIKLNNNDIQNPGDFSKVWFIPHVVNMTCWVWVLLPHIAASFLSPDFQAWQASLLLLLWLTKRKIQGSPFSLEKLVYIPGTCVPWLPLKGLSP